MILAPGVPGLQKGSVRGLSGAVLVRSGIFKGIGENALSSERASLKKGRNLMAKKLDITIDCDSCSIEGISGERVRVELNNADPRDLDTPEICAVIDVDNFVDHHGLELKES